MEKNDQFFVNKIIESIDIILDVTKDKTIKEIENNILINNTVMFQFMLIGECVARLSDEYKNKKDIPWTKIKGLRNIVVHNYDSVDYSLINETIFNDLPKLKKIIKNL